MKDETKFYGVSENNPDREGKESFLLFWRSTGISKRRLQAFKARRRDYPEVIWVDSEEEAMKRVEADIISSALPDQARSFQKI